MTGRDEVPTTAEVRERFIDGFPFWAVARATLGDEFDRWLSAHDEAVRQEEREKALREAADAVLHNVSDPAYVGDPGEYARGYRQGIRDATRALRRAAQKGDERCPQCGCEIAYPNAVHILDCGSGARAQGKDQDRCDR